MREWKAGDCLDGPDRRPPDLLAIETRAAAVAVVAQWDKADAPTKADTYLPALMGELGDGCVSEARRIDSAGALLRVPARRAKALSAIAPMLSDASAPASLKAGLIAALGDASGADIDAVLITALSRTNSTLVFDQLLRRPAASLALLECSGIYWHMVDLLWIVLFPLLYLLR